MPGADVDKAVLLLTRPEDAARRFAARVMAEAPNGLRILIAPLMQIAFRPDPFDYGDAVGVIFTSRNGVAAAQAKGAPDRLPCHCVGAATASQAQAAGWSVITIAETADDLVDRMRGATGPLLHICGAERRGDIAGRLTASGTPTREHIAYDQQLLPLSDPARTALSGSLPVIAPLFSPRTARHFARAHEGAAPLWVPVISAAVAEALETLPVRGVDIAARPDMDAMVDATVARFHTLSRVEGGPGHD